MNRTDEAVYIDYKDVEMLRRALASQDPASHLHVSALARAIEHAKEMALMPNSVDVTTIDLRPGLIDLQSSPMEPGMTNDDLQRLNDLSGEQLAVEAERLGLLVTSRGIFADPDHEARKFVTTDEAEEQIRDMFRRHDVDWSPGAGDTVIAGS